MPTWNADQYLKFDEERTQPCRDLAARIAVESPRSVMDLGCGPGNSTAVLAARWPQAELTGLDSSEDMIAKARKAMSRHQWITEDIARWAEASGEKFDVVFSNAALQWVPNHRIVYPQLLARVSAGGAFAVQMPANLNAPAHQLMRDMAASGAWRVRMPSSRIRQWHSHDVAFYYDLVAPHSKRLDIWETEYIHVLDDAGAVVEWYKGTGLRPFLDVLATESERQEFTAEYLAEIRKLYHPQENGRVLFPFRRIFLVAYL